MYYTNEKNTNKPITGFLTNVTYFYFLFYLFLEKKIGGSMRILYIYIKKILDNEEGIDT